ncbi:MAG: hypothetical protein H7338_06695 [Candidatus Sericytochromatia bacterium]|nr:hypothetical protein [Candidatus Sericytochromatia bacterium]
MVTATATPVSNGLTATVGPQTFARVIAVNPNLNLATAAAMTKKNGYDEVFLQTSSGRLFAAVGFGGKLNVREGFTGQVNGEWARVVHVDDEVNSAKEGALSPFKTIGSLFSNSGATAVTAMVSSTVGGMMAGAAMGAPSAIRLGALARTAGGAFSAAIQPLAVSGAIGIGVTAIVMGAWAGIGATRGATRKGDELTLQMLQ